LQGAQECGFVEYATLKAVHVTSAILSIAGFAARGALMLRDSPLLKAPFVRTAPHVLDTVLLASAIALAWLSGQYPFAQSWLTAKVLALIAYVVLGSIALSRGRTKRIRTQAFCLALLAALYIVSVAVLRDPAGPVSLFG
jgi:uncharacterized membrane protein SirB2